jgi:thiol-disulfide isomerase/thioredoxin
MTRRTPPRGRPVVVLGAIAVAVLLISCCAACSTNSATGGRSASSGGAASGSRGAGSGQAALTTIDGAAVRVPGTKPSVLVFLSITCADCADAARTLARVEAATNATSRAAHLATAKASFLGVDMDRGASVQAVAAFLHSVGADGLPTVLDHNNALAGAYQVTALSTVLVIDSAGRVRYRAINPSPGKILAAVDAAS